MLGRGGMGVVYLAEDPRLRRKVAVKVIDPAVESVELEARLEREARLLGRLSHPGIVPIYDLGRQDELTLFYVMKHVDGETLERWLPAHTSRADRLRLFQKLCDPVAFAHAQGVAHRDLKPANVMIGAFGEVLIMDWGLALSVEHAADAEGAGTPGYREPATTAKAPPAAHAPAAPAPIAPLPLASATAAVTPVVPTPVGPEPAAPVSHLDSTSASADSSAPQAAHGIDGLVAGDVYALGAILFFLLTGQHPPASSEPLQPRRLDPTIDTRLNAICAKATNPTRTARYNSVRELEADVLRYLDGEAVQAYREGWHEVALRWIRRNQLVLSLILAYAVMRIIVALVR
jgi:serine/threonine-protein kinase